MPIIELTSPHNEHVKAAAKLRRRKYRNAQGRTLIDGSREVTRAIEAGTNIAEIYYCRTMCRPSERDSLLEQFEALDTTVYRVTRPVFEKLAFGDRAEGVLAVVQTPVPSLADLQLPPQPVVAVLEAVEKPGNLGAVIRSADAAGISAVILADPRTDLFNPSVIRSSLGAIFSMPVCAASSAEVLDWLRQQSMRMLAARVDGSIPYTESSYEDPTAIILGSEEAGLTDLWKGDDIQAISLPMLGRVDSLNVSVTAGVLFYEARRQRELKS